MIKRIFIVTIALFSFQLQTDGPLRREAAKKQFLDTSQDESLQQSHIKKLESDKDLLFLDSSFQLIALLAQQAEKNKSLELKVDAKDDQRNKLDALSDYSEIFKSKMRTVLVAIGLQEHDENKKSEKIIQANIQRHGSSCAKATADEIRNIVDEKKMFDMDAIHSQIVYLFNRLQESFMNLMTSSCDGSRDPRSSDYLAKVARENKAAFVDQETINVK